MLTKCKDCGCSTGSLNHEYCTRCIAAWHVENDIPDDVPCADFDEPRSMHGQDEY